MKTETKLLGAILLFVIVLIFGAVFFLGKDSETQNPDVKNIDYSKGQKIGTDSAKVKLVEFSDFQCPACEVAEPFIKTLRSIDNVQLIYRHFPLPQHPYGRKAAYLAEAAGEQGKFWEMHDKLFDTQSQWSAMSDTDAESFFLSLARDLGLDEAKIRLGLTGDKYKVIIDSEIAEGRRLGVTSTPTFFLNGYKLNLQSFADLDVVVANELKK
ncbi:MAG: DsbA family protein [Candidatus Daviesbacteria bacterium]|nr:DsbA family protein [Candidatus Daviesbacteria bacterium]